MNDIHPTAVIGDDVVLGSGNVVMPYAVILGPCEIGDDNWFGTHCAIGVPPQFSAGDHGSWHGTSTDYPVVIGDRSRIREFVTIARGTQRPTTIGDECFLMARSNAPHDAEFENGVTLSGGAQVGGHTVVCTGAVLGLDAVVHQRLVIGPLAMVGMNATVTKDVPPFSMVMGTPARVVGVNAVGLERASIAPETIASLDQHYRSHPDGIPASLDGLLGQLVARYEDRLAAR